MRNRRSGKRDRITSRSLAHDVLQAVFAAKPKPAEMAFEQHEEINKLSARDRAFARLLYATTLRKLGQIDQAIKAHLERWPKDVELANCLRLGTCQLHYLQTPVHAAIGETVDLAKVKAPFGAKMVNAVLRRISETPPAASDPLNDLPKWLVQSWRDDYGNKRAKAIAGALSQAPLDLTILKDRDVWAEKLGGTPLGASTIRLQDAQTITDLDGYEAGSWWVQDVASAAIVPLMGEIEGKRVLDLCAAPGGKTAQLIAAGANVVAVEAVPARAERLKSNLSRLGMDCDMLIEDARTFALDTPVDAILLDAPCSATGTLRRHPDISWARRPVDIERLAKLQAELLNAASKHLRVGGELVYAVCSLQAPERKAQIDRFLLDNPNWRRKPFEQARLFDLPVQLTADCDYQSFPNDICDLGGMDGFYAARLTRLD